MAAIHLLATPADVPQRYEVMTGQLVIEDDHILVPDRPGLDIDLDEEAIERYPPQGKTAQQIRIDAELGVRHGGPNAPPVRDGDSGFGRFGPGCAVAPRS